MGTLVRHTDKLAARKRQQEVLQRRMAGENAADIAKAMHIHERTVYDLVNKALVAQQADDVVAYRSIDGLRIEKLIASHWSAAMHGSTEATKTIVRLLDHRAKLFGLYAPTKIDASVGVYQEPVYVDQDLMQWAIGISKRLREPLMTEAEALTLRNMMDHQSALTIEGEVTS